MSQFVKYFELLAFIAALLNWKNVKQNSFLKNLVVVVLVIVILEFIGYFLWKNHFKNLWYYNTIAIPIVFICYCSLFYNYFKKTHLRWWVLLLTITSFIVYLVSLLSINIQQEFCVLGYCSTCAVISFYSILAIQNVINKADEIDFLRIPIFYIFLTLLIYYVITIPYYAVSFLLYKQANMKNLISILYQLTAILNYLLYLTFVFVFLWEKKKS